MNRFFQSPEAEWGALDIWDTIAADDQAAADRMFVRFDEIFRMLAAQPRAGKAVPRLGRDLRFMPCGNYLIFYRPVEHGVQIIRIVHGARDIKKTFFKDQ